MARQIASLPLRQRAKQKLANLWHASVKAIQNKWRHYEPKITKLTNITVAASSATSTFTLTLGILPIIANMLTIIAVVPLFSFLIPELIYSPYFYYPAIISLSAMAGYMTYQGQVERAKLDLQIKENKRTNDKLLNRVNNLEKAFAHNQRHYVEQIQKYNHLRKSLTALQKLQTTKMVIAPPQRSSARIRALGTKI